MEKFQTDRKPDVAEDSYKGPGPFVTSAGYVYITHWAGAVLGAFSLGVLAAVSHTHVNRWVERFREGAQRWGGFGQRTVGFLFGVKPGTHSLNEVLSKTGSISTTSQKKLKELVAREENGMFHNMALGITNEISKVTSAFSKEKKAENFLANQNDDAVTAGFIGGGIGALGGWLGSTIWGIAKGGHQSNQGKKQHNQLVAALKNERERNDDLEKINDELHAKYVAASSQKEEASEQAAASEKLADAKEAPHQHAAAEAEADDAPTQQHHHETPEHSIHTHAEHDAHAEHHGKIHAHAPHEHAAHAHA
jgi:hypothetical protein